MFDCGDPLGEVEVFGAPAVEAANAYLIDTEGTGPHVVATRFELKSAAGEVLFEKNFGKKAGLTTFNCTQTGDLGDVFTLTVAVVPRALGGWTGPLRHVVPVATGRRLPADSTALCSSDLWRDPRRPRKTTKPRSERGCEVPPRGFEPRFPP